MDTKTDMFVSSRSPTQRHLPERKAAAAYNYKSTNLSSRLPESASLSNRLGYSSRNLTISTGLSGAQNNLKNIVHSPSVVSTDLASLKQRDNMGSNIPSTLGLNISPTNKATNFKPGTLDFAKLKNTEGAIKTTRENYGEDLLRNTQANLIDYPQSARLGERNRSLENLHLQFNPHSHTSMGLGSPTNLANQATLTGQAYTMAMKALQDRIRLLEEKEREAQFIFERQEEDHRLQIESLVLTHQAEMTQLVQSEINTRERAEMVERLNVEISTRMRSLEEENSYLNHEIKKHVVQRSEIEGRYGKMISDKIQGAYEDIEYGVERLKKDLDASVKNEAILKERLHQTIIESTKEKEALKVKNSTLTEALQRIEKDYNETQKGQDGQISQLSELTKKNKALEKEIEDIKNTYSQQMKEFDKELEEIDKSHANKLKENEKTISDLKQRIVDLERLINNQQETLALAAKASLNSSRGEGSSLIENVQGPSSKYYVEKQQNAKPKSLRLRPDFMHNFSEDNIDDSTPITTNRGGQGDNSPAKTGRSAYSGIAPEKSSFTAQAALYKSSRTASNKNLLNNTQKSPQQSPSNKDLDRYGSTHESSKRMLTEGDKDSFKIKPNIVPLKGLQEIQERGNMQKSLSFAKLESERNQNVAKSSARSPILKESSFSISKLKRQDTGNSEMSARSLSRRESRVMDEQLAKKEKELKELNEEYQKMIQKTQESEDSKERSRMRVYLIEITEEIQQVNEEIYQLKKQGAAQRP